MHILFPVCWRAAALGSTIRKFGIACLASRRLLGMARRMVAESRNPECQTGSTFLKAAILPSLERVPSGKNSTDAPYAPQWAQSFHINATLRIGSGEVSRAGLASPPPWAPAPCPLVKRKFSQGRRRAARQRDC